MARPRRRLAIGAVIVALVRVGHAQTIDVADGGLQVRGVAQEASTVSIKGMVGADAFELQILVPIGTPGNPVTRRLHNVACFVTDRINNGPHGVTPAPVGNARLIEHYEAYSVAPTPPSNDAAVRFKPRGENPPALTITSVSRGPGNPRFVPQYGLRPGGRLAQDAAADEGGQVCRFDTDGDGTPELVLSDADNDGLCEFPQRKTVLRGELRCSVCEPLEFEGTTIVEADAIVVEPEGRVEGGESLRSLTLVPLSGDLTVDGTFDLDAGDDVTLRSRIGDVILGPGTAIAAADRLLIDARAGSVRMTAGDGEDEQAVATAGNRIDVTARGADGSIVIDGGRLVSRRVTLSTRANLSVVEPKQIILRNGATLSTDLDDLGVSGGLTGNVTVDATGTIRLEGAVVRSSRNVVFATPRPGDALCMSDASAVSAVLRTGFPGFIDVRNVRGPSLDDGSTVFTGLVRGDVLLGVCP